MNELGNIITQKKMDQLASIILNIHIVTGFASFIIFIIPILSQKGGKIHKRLGKVYVYLMWVVVLSAATLSIRNLFLGNIERGAFLGFISIITAHPLWYGLAILNNKKFISSTYRMIHIGFMSLLVLVGLVLTIYGLILGAKGIGILMLIFGGLGLSSIVNLVHQLQNRPTKDNWIQTHIAGMIISGIAAYTAFFVFGGNQLLGTLPGYFGIIPWVLPTIIGIPIIRYWKKKYARNPKSTAESL